MFTGPKHTTIGRREFFAGAVACLMGGCNQSNVTSSRLNMSRACPERIRLIPDDWHIRHVGRLTDGRLFWVDSQLDPAGGATKDFVCSFVFNGDGHLIDHSIDLIGVRGSYPSGRVANALEEHLMALGSHTVSDIWVRLFSVVMDNTVFGLVPRQTDAGEWRVEFMPGNTLSFYPPWEAGEYDT